jgi:Asp-tRNA(Asn)/Glu-tRNA(Gln) amidotransferase A subunit family amidase
MMADLLARPAALLLADLRSGALSSVELTTACLDRIAAVEPNIRAWAYLDPALALSQARAADARRAAGEEPGALHGLPVGIKDIIDTADMPTEYNSPIYRGRRPEKDATLVARLRKAGAIVLGKTVTSEFAVYTPGPTGNPHDPTRTPGGSSSGSAAAVAARMVPLALATQTNGSTIRPASFCGIVGYKPSLGVLPRTGILKQAAMLDQPGLMAIDLAGVALLGDALAGPDPLDEQSLRPSIPPLARAVTADTTPKLAFVRGPYWDQADEPARAALEAFVSSLDDLIEEVDLPADFDRAADLQATIMNAGIADACRDDYEQSKAMMSSILLGIVEAGRKISAMEFIAALAARDRLRGCHRDLFAGFDAIVTPAAPGIAPLREQGTGDPIMATIWTLLGAPALTLPLLEGPEGMPLGVQMVGRLDDDFGLIRAAAWLERRCGRAGRVQSGD